MHLHHCGWGEGTTPANLSPAAGGGFTIIVAIILINVWLSRPRNSGCQVRLPQYRMAPNVMKYTARGLRHALLLNSPPSLFQPHARNGLGTLATYMATRSIRSPVGARSQVLMGVVAVFNTLDSRPTKNISSTRIVSHNRMICKGKFSSIPGHTTTSAQRAQRESSGRRIVLPGSSAYGEGVAFFIQAIQVFLSISW